MTKSFRDDARYWRTPLLPDAELLTAEYFEQEFAPHWHDSYSIPVIHNGAQTYRYRGALRLAGAGSIAAINPGEVHTGERATDCSSYRRRSAWSPAMPACWSSGSPP